MHSVSSSLFIQLLRGSQALIGRIVRILYCPLKRESEYPEMMMMKKMIIDADDDKDDDEGDDNNDEDKDDDDEDYDEDDNDDDRYWLRYFVQSAPSLKFYFFCGNFPPPPRAF